MKFILFHGAFGSSEGNWFPQLKDELEALNQEVIVPQFPVDDWEEVTKAGKDIQSKQQALDSWFKLFTPIVESFSKNEKLCFVGHSLGPLFVLHVVNKFDLKLDSAVFVSPFLDKLNGTWQIDQVNETFYKTDFDFERVKRLIPVSYVLYSDNDPYVKKRHSLLFAEALNSSIIFVKQAGHMNSEVNLNEFPLVFDLCLTRLDMSLYQRYLEHRKRQNAQAYIINAQNKGVIKLQPDDVIDEGKFHFRHLSQTGFCTLFTKLAHFWNPTSEYMQEARLAAKRVREFIRVIVIDQLADLKNQYLLEQVKLDLAAGIKIYASFYQDIRNKIPEMDFGIWDNDYVCTVRSDNSGQVKEVELNSRKEYLEEANKWKDIILTTAVKIYNLDDLGNFHKL